MDVPKTISLRLKNEKNTILQANELPTDKTNIILAETLDGLQNILLNIKHSGITTFLDFSGFRDTQILYFNKDNDCVGGSLALNNDKGGFMLQVQARKVLLIDLGVRDNVILKDIVSMHYID